MLKTLLQEQNNLNAELFSFFTKKKKISMKACPVKVAASVAWTHANVFMLPVENGSQSSSYFYIR